MSEITGRLADTTVLITRPAHLAHHFIELVELAGGIPVSLPAIDIMPIAIDFDQELSQAEGSQEHLAIFISRNAVDYGSHLVAKMPSGTRVIAIGRRTAAQLQQTGIEVAYAPDHGFTSEDLLESPELQALDNTHVFIIGGEGGRNLLADELEDRGATVSRLSVYRRCRPDVAITELEEKLITQHPDAVTITSVETLRNYLELASKLTGFNAKTMPVIAGSKRIAEEVVDAGFTHEPWIAADPTDESMFKALVEWKNTSNPE